ncbi:MAG: M15 family metallopeptidase [Methylococcales bacterium]|nr:M15 family metallopeptidase [Methylococcaceae bacterium]
MAVEIKGSVGRLGNNNADDVVTVQQLLLQQGLAIGQADGQCGPRTIAGITTFQSGFLNHPDGLVEPRGKTLQRLNMVGFKPSTTSSVAPKVTSPQAINQAVPSEVSGSITRLVRRSSLGVLNPGLGAVNNTYMIDKLGKPRESFSADCQAVTNDRLKKYIHTASVGPFRATGLKPAVESLRVIMSEISTKHPDIYTALGSAGMLCCRYVRGSTTSISNHSWGTAIDLTLKGVLDKRGDGMVQYGLTLMAPIFNSHGWYWGAAFHTEDAMHFEVGRALLETWLPDLK